MDADVCERFLTGIRKQAMLKNAIKRKMSGASWHYPVLNMIFALIDPLDYLMRTVNGLSYVPKYSIRVRSNGISHQFGGKRFYALGNRLAELLQTYAGLNNQSHVLEIGCGCGRTALALSKILEDGRYTGLDIEKKSLQSCRDNQLFRRKGFVFDYLDVYNTEYNPTGIHHADEYTFAYDNHSFDVIFLVSVFTHMLTDDVRNYIAEISRMLKPGGVCMLTTFLMDKGRQTGGLSFPFQEKDHCFYNREMPEVAVGYWSDFYIAHFASHGLTRTRDVLWGSWRNSPNVPSISGFSQDILLFQKDGKAR